MRGTGSHDIVLNDVFVAEAQVLAPRSWGELDRLLLVTALRAFPVICATYLGVAEGLVDAVLSSGKLGGLAARLVGHAPTSNFGSRGGRSKGVLADLGDDPDPTVDNFVALQQMKRAVTLACQNIATLVAELAGGVAYARRGNVDRMIRDVRAALYHPYPPDTTQPRAGQHRLGLPLEPV